MTRLNLVGRSRPRQDVYSRSIQIVVVDFGAAAVAGWVAWTTLVWSLGWRAFLLAASPGDRYFPVAHHLVPLGIGFALLQGAR